jgi:membrane-associated phospholipid phosphatase
MRTTWRHTTDLSVEGSQFRGRRRRHSAKARHPLGVEALEERCLPSADVVLEWNAIALDALKNDSLLAHPRQNNPGNASRALATVQAAVFDAVNSISRSYDPYLFEVNAPPDASLPAAAAQAAHDTLVALFPDYQPTLDARLADDLSHGGSLLSRVEGVLVGRVVAAGSLAVRSHDGSGVSMDWPSGTQPGQWQPDPLHPAQSAWGPDWGAVTPFTLTSGTQFPVPPPPALTSQAYADAYNEVVSLGGDGVTTPTLRTEEQTQIGIFWGYDGSPGLGTPPRLYNQIAETLAVQMKNTVVENARYFALVNLAMADAGIDAWAAKYQYGLWRPVTATRAGDTDGNPLTVADPTWVPLGAPADNGTTITDPNHPANFTPPFPAYVSGHATFGGALFRMMADFFGTDRVHFTVGSDEFNGVTKDQFGKVRPVLTRSFDSFSDAAEENGQSRIYLGIHWTFDKVEGIALGTSVADYVFHHFLRPTHNRGATADGATERLYAEVSTPAGPTLSPVPLPSSGVLDVCRNFSVNGRGAVNLAVVVDASRLGATAQGNPAADLDAAFGSLKLSSPVGLGGGPRGGGTGDQDDLAGLP